MAYETKQDIRRDVAEQFGAVSLMTEKKTIKNDLFKFSRDGIYLGVALVQTYNEKLGRYNEEVPRISISVDGKFANPPMDGEWWEDFSNAVGKVAEIMKGVKYTRRVLEGDTDAAKAALSKYVVKK